MDSAALLQHMQSSRIEPADRQDWIATISGTLLRQTRYLDGIHFTRIHPSDLVLLFDLYDTAFFQGHLRQALGNIPLHFRLSRRMTRAGGKLTRRMVRVSGGQPETRAFEIAISADLLFGSFCPGDEPILVSGLPCANRLTALMRIMEHEIVHLLESILWNESSCAAARFQSITARYFGHTDYRHNMITPVDRARRQFGLQPGQVVSFRFQGRIVQGVINRIHQRATVLVESTAGEPYSDGKHYKKYYVPLDDLTAVKPVAS